MKVLLILIGFIAITAGSHENGDETDWKKVDDLVDSIEEIYLKNLKAVTKIAEDDNKNGGKKVSEILDHNAERAEELFKHIHKEIKEKELTVSEWKFDYLIGFYQEVAVVGQAKVQEGTKHLSREAQIDIVLAYRPMYAKAYEISAEIEQLLPK